MPSVLSIDFETYSSTDLRQTGVEAYSLDPTAEVLICSYSINYKPKKSWVPELGEMPSDLKERLDDPETKITAFNAPFERACFANILGINIPLDRLYDTMVLARFCGLPSTLEKVAEAVGGDLKDSKGKALIKWFSIPRKPTKRDPRTRNTPSQFPDKFDEFVSYCDDDVAAEVNVLKKLARYNIPSERETWLVDQKINNRGIPVDMPLVRAIDRLYSEAKRRKLLKMEGITGLENTNSRDQLLGWLKSEGYKPNDLKATSIERALTYPDQLSSMGIEVLEMRASTSVSSAAKYKAVIRAAVNGRLRHTLSYYGASRTGRWAGRVYQPQNLPRPDKHIQDNLEEVIEDALTLPVASFIKKWDLVAATKTLTRPIVKADPGKTFAVADLSSIENVVLGWVADEQSIIKTFRDGRDPYKTFAVDLFGVKYEDVTKTQRTIAKPPVLGAGYRLGAGGTRKDKKGNMVAYGLYGYAQAFGIDMDKDQCEKAIAVWREKHPNVVKLWYDIENACKKTIATKRKIEVGRLTVQMNGPFLEIVLPSGRPLRYYKPKVEMKMAPWGEPKPTITFLAAQWGMSRVGTHGGKLVENCFTGDTPIVTSTGVKPIRDITPSDWVFDGVEFVRSGGAKLMGRKNTMIFQGVSVTPDHLILTTRGWKRVEEIKNAPADLQAPVYDILNCGPRNRFVVRGDVDFIAHNCVQAVARDILAHGLVTADHAGMDIVMHVHDEIICEVDDGEQGVKELIDHMTTMPDWGDDDLILRADGYHTERYVKE